MCSDLPLFTNVTGSLIIHEDDDLLVVNKPANWNTHAPTPYSGEGIYEWLRQREPRWAQLAIIHRLDKETSGVMVFTKTKAAAKSLTEQFTEREVQKRYVLLTDRAVKAEKLHARSHMSKVGSEFVSRPVTNAGELAETFFYRGESKSGRTQVSAEPKTGRTHQIRLHAQDLGFPILGDVRYGGSPHARLCLHAAEIEFEHPTTGKLVKYSAPVDFERDASSALREAVVDKALTDSFRVVHGAADGRPGWYVEKLGDYLISQSSGDLSGEQRARLEELVKMFASKAAYHKVLNRHVRQSSVETAGPQLVFGEAVNEEFGIRENGVRYQMSFQEGYSVGLFLDQRDNRRRLLTNYIGPDFVVRDGGLQGAEVLNTFAYTCGFSVAAGMAGARATSLDLSKKYLDWGRRNFTANGMDPAAHDFIFGDVFDWLKRLGKKQRQFDVVILDPPTFSQSKQSGVFRVERDYGRLVGDALKVLKSGGTLLASTNAAGLEPEVFIATVKAAITAAGRKVERERFIPQPPDFPVTREEPGYLKTFWVRVK
ncbi:MAG TPA: class I SAM-dependent methyltransferase [Verrucomicrobiae bacterium]